MAQYLIKPVDLFPASLANALRILRSAADFWALHGQSSLDVDPVLALIVPTLLSFYSDAGTALSITTCIHRARPLRDVLPTAFTKRGQQAIAGLSMELTDILTSAVKAWSNGSPEIPSTADVLLQLANTMFNHRLLRRPPPRRIEE